VFAAHLKAAHLPPPRPVAPDLALFSASSGEQLFSFAMVNLSDTLFKAVGDEAGQPRLRECQRFFSEDPVMSQPTHRGNGVRENSVEAREEHGEVNHNRLQLWGRCPVISPHTIADLTPFVTQKRNFLFGTVLARRVRSVAQGAPPKGALRLCLEVPTCKFTVNVIEVTAIKATPKGYLGGTASTTAVACLSDRDRLLVAHPPFDFLDGDCSVHETSLAATSFGNPDQKSENNETDKDDCKHSNSFCCCLSSLYS
jgi:hypothetical protein